MSEDNEAQNTSEAQPEVVSDQPIVSPGDPGTEGSPPLEPIPVPNLEQIVEDWWDSHIRGSIIGQSSQTWNYMQEAKEKLKGMLGR